MARPWTLRLLACLATGAVSLTGCSAKTEASESLPSASTSPATPSLAPLGPKDLPMPAEARTKDAAGAEAFVRYYIALINRTSTVMDAKPLRDFSQNCRDCNRIAANTEKDAKAGLHYEEGQITITQVAQPLLKLETAELAIRVDQARFVVADNSGAPAEGGSKPYTSVPGGAALKWDSGQNSWLMTDLTFG